MDYHPQTLHQNVVVEQKNIHILEAARAFLIYASALQTYWADAVTYIIYLINQMPTKVLDSRTPLAVLAKSCVIAFFTRSYSAYFC